MTTQEAINFVDIARMSYICDPQECGLEKGEDPCTAFHCDEMHDALVMATEALEKQIPEKPNANDYYGFYHCPACEHSLVEYKWSGGIHYCHYCGQAIDWSDTDE